METIQFPLTKDVSEPLQTDPKAPRITKETRSDKVTGSTYPSESKVT